jgi:hypothetical protein
MAAQQNPLDRPNEKRDDAFSRVSYAMTGSLVNPTTEYLEALREYLYVWIHRVDEKIDLLARQEEQDLSDNEDRNVGCP